MAKKLRPFLAELRPLARDARPTINDLSKIVSRPGGANDLIELTKLQVPLRDVTTRKFAANGKERDGAFKVSQDALKGNTPEFAFFRPYTPDLLGWFDDFSHSGTYDALGAASRVGIHANPFALTGTGGAGQYELIPPELRDEALQATLERAPEQPLPRRRRAQDRRRQRPLQAHPRLPLRPVAGAPRQMRRALVVILVLAGAGAYALTSTGAKEESGSKFTVEFDNAFGLVKGGDVKVAGVRAGTVSKLRLDKKSHRALVDFELTKQGFGSLRADSTCESRPQSLIGEYFIDCTPGKSTDKLKPGATIPVEQTTSTIPADLLANVMRRPYRERLRIILDELGAGVGGRAEDLNATIRRASPALRETDKVLEVLGRQNQVLKDLTTNADTVIGDLAGNHRNVGRFVKEAEDVATTSADAPPRDRRGPRAPADLPARAAPDDGRARRHRRRLDPVPARPQRVGRAARDASSTTSARSRTRARRTSARSPRPPTPRGPRSSRRSRPSPSSPRRRRRRPSSPTTSRSCCATSTTASARSRRTSAHRAARATPASRRSCPTSSTR